MTQEINRQLHEALGKCWHILPKIDELVIGGKLPPCPKCGKSLMDKDYFDNPDYCADPRLVIEVMREKHPDFISYIAEMCDYKIADFIYYIMDKTGKLANLALEWIKQQRGEKSNGR